MRFLSRALVLGLVAVLPTGLAAQDREVELLREQVERMSKLIEVQNRAILNLERRLRSVEQAAPAQPPVEPPAEPPAEPRPPATAPAPPQVSPPAEQPGDSLAAPDAPPDEEETVKKQADPARSLEVVAGEERGYFGRRFTIEPAISYSRIDRSQIVLNGFLALDAIFLGDISVDEVESDVVTFDVTGRMGVTDDLQIDVNLPYIYRYSNFISGGAGGGSASQIEDYVRANNLGDIGFGANYRVVRETDVVPDVVVNVRGRAPTGRHPYGIELKTVEGSEGNLTVPEELPTGNGVWQVSGGVSALKTFDPALLFMSIDYFHNFRRGFDDISSSPGDQPGKVDVGDSIQFGFGIAYALNERLSLNLSYTQRLFEETRTKLDGGDWEDVIGSDANVARLNSGFTFAISDSLSLVSSISAGLTQDAPDVEVRIGFPFSF